MKSTYQRKLDVVLRKTGEKGVRLNPDNCTFRTNHVTYFGHILSADGLPSDPVKTPGIREMPPPTTRDELDTVFGMVTYLGKFVPNLADVTAQLRDATKKENEFIWDAVKDRACEADVVQATRSSSRLL